MHSGEAGLVRLLSYVTSYTKVGFEALGRPWGGICDSVIFSKNLSSKDRENQILIFDQRGSYMIKNILEGKNILN